MRDAGNHFCDIMKSFKVADLNAMLAAKGKVGKVTKADLTLDVSWCYTPEEVMEFNNNRRLPGLPAILTNGREPGQQSIRDSFG